MNNKVISLGVSACLLGQEVRYDGGHKHSRYLTDTLADFFELVPVCPEAEVGMGIPRETVRLEGELESPRMMASKSRKDWTGPMNKYSRQKVRQFKDEELSGFVFKKGSPSCGLFKVKVIQENGQPLAKGRGLFAAEFSRQFPHVPVEDEGRLHDPAMRENFLERVFAYHRVREVFDGRWKRDHVVAFHGKEKYSLLAHSPRLYRDLGRLVAKISEYKPSEFRQAYLQLYMEGHGVKATVKRHVNALQHIAGHLKKLISPEQNRSLHRVIDDFGNSLVPLIVPMTLLRHYVELTDVSDVQDQVYLNPHPKELMLRNHV